MEQNKKPGLYTRILRFLFRDLYSRTEHNIQRGGQLTEELDSANSKINELNEKISELSEELSRVREENEELAAQSRLKIQQLSDEGAEHFISSEQRMNTLFAYHTEVQRRMESDDRTTISLAHRIEVMEQSLRDNNLMPVKFDLFNKKTYSQSGEDAVIMYVAAMLGIPLSQCNYLDLGANYPKNMSNTYFFYEQGARGVLVEANCSLIPALEEERPLDIVLNKCVSDKSGEKLPFNVLNLDGLSKVGDISDILAANPDARLERTVELETITVTDIVNTYFDGKAPVIMNLDIEGLERQILDSMDFESCRPMIMIIEMIPYSTKLSLGRKDEELLEYVRSKGYVEYAFTGINSIFIDERRYKELTESNNSRKEETAGG